MNTRLSLKAAAAYRSEQMLMHHIFPRLAVKTLLRCKSVCKAWNRIICDPHFISLHLKLIQQQNSHNHKLLFRIADMKYYYFSVDLGQSDAVEVKFDFQYSDWSPTYVGSYNGLVCIAIQVQQKKDPTACCLMDRTLPCFNLFLWNPLTTQTKLIPDPNPLVHHLHMVGFIYDSTLDDYKVIRIFHTPETNTCALDIYSLKTNSWMILKEAPPEIVTFKHFSRLQHRGFELNGFMYWHVYSGHHSRHIYYSFIFALCLEDTSFFEIKFSQDILGPRPTGSADWDFRALGTCLAAFKIMELTEFVMWTMKDPDKKERKWEKFITLSLCLPEFLPTKVIKPICFTTDGKVLLFISEATQQMFGLYDPQKGTVEFNQIYGARQYKYSTDVMEIAYIETLVSPNMFESKNRRVTTRRKRKRCGRSGC